MGESTLKEKTAKGLLWGGMSNGMIQVLSALFGIILLRLLTPDDYGKIAVLVIFSNIANNLQESGFVAALCNKKEPLHEDYNAVFWFNIIVSVCIYIILPTSGMRHPKYFSRSKSGLMVLCSGVRKSVWV